MIRVIIVEDSAAQRELIAHLLSGDPEIEVVGQAADGREAVELAARLRPDVITMDVHMPIMNGLEATREIMRQTPTRILVVTSSESRPDVERSFDAIRAGALMLLPKPGLDDAQRMDGESRHLLEMVKAMAGVKVVRLRDGRPERGRVRVQVPTTRPRLEIIALAASTGGPAALHRVIQDLPPKLPVPIVVVQHIAHGFLHNLADWLSAGSDWRVRVARDGEQLEPGTVVLAPDERHLTVERGRVRLEDSPPIRGHRPSAERLFSSIAQEYGRRALAVMLTGMGSDGVEGLRELKARHGLVVAQDESSSIVFGMPREAIRAGVVDRVLPLHRMASELVKLVVGGQDE